MFPKFLRVAANYGLKKKLWINETSFIWKTVLLGTDQPQLDVIAGALGFSYEVKFPSDAENNLPFLNRTWNGAFGMLQRREVDMVIGDFDINVELYKDFRFSYPHSVYESTFMTRLPEHVPNPAVFLNPFSIQVWFAILACVCLVPFIFHYLLIRKNSVPNLLMSILGSLLGQGMSLTPRRPREYFVLASWILSSAFLYLFYAAVLLSFVTFPPTQGIRTIKDLAKGIKAKKYECATFTGSDYSLSFIATRIRDLRVIGKNLQNHRDFIEYLEESIGGKKPAFVGLRRYFLAYKDYYYIPDENFMFSSLAYMTRKDFCCGLQLDKAFHHAWASGIFKKIDADFDYQFIFSQHAKEYSKYWDNSSSETKLTMTMLKGPFVFLICSHSLAFLVFLIEVCIGKFQKHGFALSRRPVL